MPTGIPQMLCYQLRLQIATPVVLSMEVNATRAQVTQSLESKHADLPNPRLAPLRHLLHHPRLLAAHPSPRKTLALQSAIPLQNPPAPLDRNVDHFRSHHRPMATHRSLSKQMDMDSSRPVILRRRDSLQTFAHAL